MQECVSKGIISYITAKVKCPLYGGRKDHHEPEAVAKVSGVAAGYGREDHPEGGGRKNGCVLPSNPTHAESF